MSPKVGALGCGAFDASEGGVPTIAHPDLAHCASIREDEGCTPRHPTFRAMPGPRHGPSRLGPFQLLSRFASGGMAEVWHGYHPVQRRSVAIKVITTSYSDDDRYIKRFEREVQAVAGLDHPGIVAVYDYGQVSSSAALGSEGDLVAGSPYLVMEYAPAGSLRELPLPLPWPMLRAVMLAMLDALAHAHARGVIHRDLKPSNVLLSGGEHGGSLVRLTDFGLAQAMNADGGVDDLRVAGTPAYMAPEQFSRTWRAQGPWTDLYALGCMAWELACGERPFEGDSVPAIAAARLHGPMPRMVPATPVPRGFDAWVARLLARDPLARFQRAADAAWALASLPELVDATPEWVPRHTADHPALTSQLADTPPRPQPAPSLVLHELDQAPSPVRAVPTLESAGFGPLTTLSPFASAALAETLRTPSEEDGGARFEDVLPPLPESWRRPHADRPPERLEGAGLTLLAMRPPPLLGREATRDALWRALRDAAVARRVRATIVEGASGREKRRVALWLSERAHEVGAALCVDVARNDRGALHWIAEATNAVLRVSGLSREQAMARVAGYADMPGAALERDDIPRLATVLHPFLNDASEPREYETAEVVTEAQAQGALRRLLLTAAGRRAVVMTIDAHASTTGAIGFVHDLLIRRDRDSLPFFALLTVDDDQEPSPLRDDAIDLVRSCLRVEVLRAEPLSQQHHHTLIHSLLALDPALLREVAERTEGVPRFAIDLVRGWVEADALEATPRGYRLRAGYEDLLPQPLYELLLRRLQRVASVDDVAASGRTWRALELAATLGVEVDTDDWYEAAHLVDVVIAPDLVERLVEAGIAVLREGGWAFAHPLLRDGAVRHAHEQDRTARWHRACARMLRRRTDAWTVVARERSADHLIRGELDDEALVDLVAATRARADRGEVYEAHAVADRLDATLDRLGAGPSDRNRSVATVARAEIELAAGRLDVAVSLASRAVAMSQDFGWSDVEEATHIVMAEVVALRGDLRGSADQLRAITERRGATDAIGARARVALATVARRLGARDEAMGLLDAAAPAFEAAGDALYRAHIALERGYIAIAARDTVAAEAAARAASALVGAVDGAPTPTARLLRLLAAIAWLDRRTDDAAALLRKAAGVVDAAHAPQGACARVELAFAAAAAGRIEEAAAALDLVDDAMRTTGQRLLAAHVDLGYAWLAIDAGNTVEAETLLDEAAAALDASRLDDAVLAAAARQLATAARRAGAEDAALRADRIASRHEGTGVGVAVTAPMLSLPVLDS